MIVQFCSKFSGACWTLVTIYGPCPEPDRLDFVQWFHDLSIPDDEDWILLGDFNFYKSVQNRN